MPLAPPMAQTILHIRPSDPTRTAIAGCADDFRAVFDAMADAEVVDFLPAELSETIDSRAARRAVERFVDRAADGLLASQPEGAAPVVHVEMGNACHREFWAARQLRKRLPGARFFCTVHDPPTLIPFPEPLRFFSDNAVLLWHAFLP